jgi:hypothetical protein
MSSSIAVCNGIQIAAQAMQCCCPVAVQYCFEGSILEVKLQGLTVGGVSLLEVSSLVCPVTTL